MIYKTLRRKQKIHDEPRELLGGGGGPMYSGRGSSSCSTGGTRRVTKPLIIGHVWWLYLQSVPITTKTVGVIPCRSEMYSLQFNREISPDTPFSFTHKLTITTITEILLLKLTLNTHDRYKYITQHVRTALLCDLQSTVTGSESVFVRWGHWCRGMLFFILPIHYIFAIYITVGFIDCCLTSEEMTILFIAHIHRRTKSYNVITPQFPRSWQSNQPYPSYLFHLHYLYFIFILYSFYLLILFLI